MSWVVNAKIFCSEKKKNPKVLSGRFDSPDASVEALFLPKGSSHRWVLAEASIKTAGHVFDVPDGDGLKLQYSVLSYSENVKTAVVGTEDGSAFAPPPGVFCPPLEHATYRPPPLAEQFSFDIETILEVRRLSSSQQPTVDFFFCF
jgi:hypothetical protein